MRDVKTSRIQVAHVMEQILESMPECCISMYFIQSKEHGNLYIGIYAVQRARSYVTLCAHTVHTVRSTGNHDNNILNALCCEIRSAVDQLILIYREYTFKLFGFTWYHQLVADPQVSGLYSRIPRIRRKYTHSVLVQEWLFTVRNCQIRDDAKKRRSGKDPGFEDVIATLMEGWWNAV